MAKAGNNILFGHPCGGGHVAGKGTCLNGPEMGWTGVYTSAGGNKALKEAKVTAVLSIPPQ